LVIVAILTVHRAEIDAFRSFERSAFGLMQQHGGKLERSVVVDDGASPVFTEIHFVRFETAEGFGHYRVSPELARLRELRERCIVDTQIFVGEDGPTY
jgi:hypothetical protein